MPAVGLERGGDEPRKKEPSHAPGGTGCHEAVSAVQADESAIILVIMGREHARLARGVVPGTYILYS